MAYKTQGNTLISLLKDFTKNTDEEVHRADGKGHEVSMPLLGALTSRNLLAMDYQEVLQTLSSFWIFTEASLQRHN